MYPSQVCHPRQLAGPVRAGRVSGVARAAAAAHTPVSGRLHLRARLLQPGRRAVARREPPRRVGRAEVPARRLICLGYGLVIWTPCQVSPRPCAVGH